MNVQYVQPSCSVTKRGEHGHPSQGASRITGRGKAWSHGMKAKRDSFGVSIAKVLAGRAMKDLPTWLLVGTEVLVLIFLPNRS